MSAPRNELKNTVTDVVRAAAALTPVTAVIAELSAIPAARRERRWRAFVEELLVSWDIELEALSIAVSDERIAALLEHAQRVAEHSRYEEKLRFAVRIVSSVIRGECSDERIDTANVLLQLIDSLDACHLEVLTVIGSPRQDVSPLDGQSVIGGWTMTELQNRIPEIRELLPVIVASLSASGLIRDSGTASVSYGGLGRHQLGPTDAGSWLLAHLLALKVSPEQEP